MTDVVDLTALAALATDVAVEAGRLLLAGRDDVLAVDTKSTPTDVVTQMDRASERLIIQRLLAARPTDAVLGEEGGERPGAGRVRWVVDPLDGTVNYLYRLPTWSVSIAAEVDGVPRVGVVEVPALGERYVGVDGGGSVLVTAAGSRPLRVSPVARLDEALVGTGFGYDARRRAAQAAVVAALLPEVRDIRRAGAASVDLCSVAAGRLDGYFERGLQPWDLAAGGVVAREAGAIVAGVRGAEPGEDLVVAAGPALFAPLAQRLADLGADRD